MQCNTTQRVDQPQLHTITGATALPSIVCGCEMNSSLPSPQSAPLPSGTIAAADSKYCKIARITRGTKCDFGVSEREAEAESDDDDDDAVCCSSCSSSSSRDKPHGEPLYAATTSRNA